MGLGWRHAAIRRGDSKTKCKAAQGNPGLHVCRRSQAQAEQSFRPFCDSMALFNRK
jgi:hypothetical protein